MKERELTGKMVLAIFVSMFAIIIGVNLTLAYKAVKTFPGLEVKNSYVASQSFDVRRTAQLGLGWDVSLDYDQGELRLSINDDDGPVRVEQLKTTLGRATHVRDDLSPKFEFDGVNYVAQVELPVGNWNLRMVATAPDGTEFTQRVVLRVRDK